MDTPRAEETIESIITRLTESRLVLLGEEFSRAGNGILSELATARAGLENLLHKGLKEEIVRQVSSVLADHDRQRDETVQLQLAQATSRAGDLWRNRLTAMVSFGQAILASPSQTEIMAHMVDATSHFAGRVVLFVGKGDYLVGWRTGGSAWKPPSPAPGSMAVPNASPTAVALARVGQTTFRGEPGEHEGNGMLLDLLGEARPERIMAVPVVVAGKVPAVLYADHRFTDQGPMDEEAILFLVSLARHRIEMIGLRRGMPGEAARAEGISPQAPPEPGPQRRGSTTVEPTRPPSPEPALRPAVPPPPARSQAPRPMDPRTAAAQRLARVIVSEIKLYNEPALAEGRAGKNIYLRLKHDIDVSRKHYQSKVSPETAAQGDFLHEEIIRTLALGDPSLMGWNYPGPVSP